MKTKIILVLALGIFFACKKEKKEEVKSISETETLLKAGKWNKRDQYYFQSGTKHYVVYAVCTSDDYLTFSAGSYSNSDNTTVCSPTSNSTGTWGLSADQKILTKDGVEYNITKISSDSLKFYREYQDANYGLTQYYYAYKNVN